MFVGFCVVFQSGDSKVVRKQTEYQVDHGLDDQYSIPACSSRIKSSGCRELGLGTTQLLGVLRALENNDTGLESAWR